MLGTVEHEDGLQRVVRRFLQERNALGAARAAFDSPSQLPGFWRELVALGWLGLHLPEEFGGSGFGLSELAQVLEEWGRAVAPGPLLSTVASSAAINACGTDAQRMALLPALADGSCLAAIALDGDSVTTRSGRLHAEQLLALGPDSAGVVLVRSAGDLVAVPSSARGVKLSSEPSLDPTHGVTVVALDGVDVSDVHVFEGCAERAFSLIRTLSCAEAVGGASACLARAIAYVKIRNQFGRAIGSFQAVKHHCANMHIALELASAATWDAIASSSESPEQAALASAVATSVAIPAFLANAQLNIQLHGAIGYTWDNDAHIYLRRASSLKAMLQPARAAADVVRLKMSGVVRTHDLRLPPESDQLRETVRQAVSEMSSFTVDEQRRRLRELGYLMPSLPSPWGWSAGVAEQLVVSDELSSLDLPEWGVGAWIVSTLAECGSPEQLERWVPPTLEGRIRWCQMFSEPEAGSDAASVRSVAVRTDGGWLVTGHKVWTTDAHRADLGLMTVRTERGSKRHSGLTAMVIDLHGAGVEVKPIRDQTGASEINEIHCREAFVPDADVVGAVGDGWNVARATLGGERLTVGAGGYLGDTLQLDLFALYQKSDQKARESAPAVGAVLAHGEAIRALQALDLARAVAGSTARVDGNIAKLLVAEYWQRAADAALDLLGPAAVLLSEDGGRFAHALLYSRCLTIAGGASEVLRTVIAERVLGLPREPIARGLAATTS